MSVYLFLRGHDTRKHWKLEEMEIVLQTGWTLDYIRSLSIQEFHDCIQIFDGIKKAKR